MIPKIKNKTSFQLMKEFSSNELKDFNNNGKHYKLKSPVKESNIKYIDKSNKKDNLFLKESAKDLRVNTMNNNNKFSPINNDSLFISSKDVKYKLKIANINENNKKNDIPSSDKKRLYDEEVNLIIKKKILYYMTIK